MKPLRVGYAPFIRGCGGFLLFFNLFRAADSWLAHGEAIRLVPALGFIAIGAILMIRGCTLEMTAQTIRKRTPFWRSEIAWDEVQHIETAGTDSKRHLVLHGRLRRLKIPPLDQWLGDDIARMTALYEQQIEARSIPVTTAAPTGERITGARA